MEISRDDNSQSLSMALKQKDSKIGVLSQNLQQQESENMAMEAKWVNFQIRVLLSKAGWGYSGMLLTGRWVWKKGFVLG